MKLFIYIAILLSFICASCSPNGSMDETFADIDAMCDSDAKVAMSMLDSIDYGSLSVPDRHRYDLLSVKTRDKAYVRHTSDSLILDVIDYYQAHQKSGLYPEALYYGGRVYSDMGDLPAALEFFQKAIDVIPESGAYLKQKSVLLSQTGRLLNELRLYGQAIPYIKKAIAISTKRNDSKGIFYDNMLLVSLYRNCDSLQLASKCLSEAAMHVSGISMEDIAWMETEKASLLLHQGKIDSAVSVIRPALHAVDSVCRNYALSVSSEVYKAAGMMDTAYIYAKELAFSPHFNNRTAGFNILFSSEISPFLPKDSIDFFIQAYGKYMDDYLDRYESQDALLQNTKYNYSLQQRKRDQAIEEKLKAQKERNIIIIISCILLIILLALIYHGIHTLTKNKFQLRLAYQLAQYLLITQTSHATANPKRYEKGKTSIVCIKTIDLQKHTDIDDSMNDDDHEDFIEDVEYMEIFYETEDTNTIKDRCQIEDQSNKRLRLPFISQQARLRKDLLASLHRLIKEKNATVIPDPEIMTSPVVKRLKKMLVKNKGIQANDHATWLEIEKTVHSFAPEFKSRLLILSLDQMSKGEYHAALLTRCGFKPKEVSDLLCLGKSGSSDRRRSLAKKILQNGANSSDMDRLIFII